MTTDSTFLRLMGRAQELDTSLPSWARRSNPIVRRQLGIYWKTLPLELGVWLRVLAVEAALILLAVPFPLVYSFIMPIVTVSVLLVPLVFVLYGQALFTIASQSSAAMVDEVHNQTLDLLLATPLPRRHILFSKIAATVWRQLDNLSLVIVGHVLLSLPVFILIYAGLYTAEDQPWLTAAAIILALFGSLARLLLEPVMVAAVGVMVGALVQPRLMALIVTVALCGAYFVLLNLPRLMSLTFSTRLLLELGLPLILPAALIWLALAVAVRVVGRD